MPEWLVQVLVVVGVLGLVGYIWRTHEEHDKERNEDIWKQIGRDSESGMRKVVHRSANEIVGINGDLDDLMRRVERIERHLNGSLRREDER